MKTQNKYTLLHRLLHWTMALALPLLFITGFLRMYWMNKHHTVDVIKSKIPASTLSNDQMVDIAKTIREPMWEWHIIFAYVMIFAFLIRIVYMIVKGIRFPNPFRSKISIKERFQGLTYIYFYLFVLISAVTGILIHKHFFEQWKDGIETVHKLGIYWFPIFILLHLVGILIAEHSNKKGIVSKMIGGK